MSTCQAKIRVWDKEDGVFQCRKPYGHTAKRVVARQVHAGDLTHVATGLYGYQTIEWTDGNRRQFTGEWVPCLVTGSCPLPMGHHGQCA